MWKAHRRPYAEQWRAGEKTGNEPHDYCSEFRATEFILNSHRRMKLWRTGRKEGRLENTIRTVSLFRGLVPEFMSLPACGGAVGDQGSRLNV